MFAQLINTFKKMKKNVLIVDDDPQNRLFMESCFLGTHFVVTTAADGKDALDKFNAKAFDIVITDFFMPGFNGIQLCKRYAIRIRIKKYLIGFTGASFEDDDPEMAELGFNGILHKPLEKKSLIALVEQLVK